MIVGIKHLDKSKQKELEDYISRYNMTFKDILFLISKGIKDTVKKDNKPVLGNAFRKGLYIGCPGKDIYLSLMLMSLNDEQIYEISCALSRIFPVCPPSGKQHHVHIAACIRYIYGCFDKNGALLSKDHELLIVSNIHEWGMCKKLMCSLIDEFKIINNKYGLVICYEMKGHRLGDKAIAFNDLRYLEEMSECYIQSQKIALSIKSYKHTFTPFYWAARYWERFDKEIAMEYHIKCLDYINKFCPDTRQGYIDKAKNSILYLQKHMTKQDWQKYKIVLRKFRNKCLIKSLRLLNL